MLSGEGALFVVEACLEELGYRGAAGGGGDTLTYRGAANGSWCSCEELLRSWESVARGIGAGPRVAVRVAGGCGGTDRRRFTHSAHRAPWGSNHSREAGRQGLGTAADMWVLMSESPRPLVKPGGDRGHFPPQRIGLLF